MELLTNTSGTVLMMAVIRLTEDSFGCPLKSNGYISRSKNIYHCTLYYERYSFTFDRVTETGAYKVLVKVNEVEQCLSLQDFYVFITAHKQGLSVIK